MLRKQLNEALKEAMLAKDGRATATLRLILAALKDRDIAARTKGQLEDVAEGISEDEIHLMLQTMIKQRRESIEMYEKGGRLDLVEQERNEIEVISRFLPEQLDEVAISQAVKEVIGELGASNLKDMGRTMAALRERYAGRMDFGKASGMVKQQLAR
ncbi:MAG: GatB/YqeY domain-containing protein [Alphaproteobacteria bacterium]|nr:GatB/YqeY domain-containing protein [Alphaproteobacteria bacterium]